jgi:hypothetical protein
MDKRAEVDALEKKKEKTSNHVSAIAHPAA